VRYRKIIQLIIKIFINRWVFASAKIPPRQLPPGLASEAKQGLKPKKI
jgi:hypothetical protein